MSEAVSTADPVVVDESFFQDPFPVLDRLRERAPATPVLFADGFGVPRWFVGRYADVVAGFTDPRLSNVVVPALAPPGVDRAELPAGQRVLLRANDLLGRAMANTDPPDHTRLRRLVSAAFGARPMDALRPRVRELVAAALDAAGEEFDLMAVLARPLPITVVCEVLGVPAADAEVFRAAARVLGGFADEESAPEVIGAMDRFADYAADLVAHKRRRPADDLLTTLVEVSDEGDRLTGDELVAMLALMIFAGHETTVQLIGGGVLALLTHPDQAALLRAEPGRLPDAVDEVLRFDGSANPGLPRLATADVPVGDVVVPRGAHVILATAAANRDPRAWDRPDEFDVTRERRQRQLAFGHGIHYCLGARMARIEGEEAVGALLSRHPGLRLAVEPAALRWRTGFVRALEALPLTTR
ncbi:cytochrome P450 [Saccharothrix xinjiangensis]|uniref:Cytochrome P450 n=1 Tax=Saccharothrix xinjiangensis TaxID=204798 RepID=A0ABV9YIN6_9PSEU